MSNKMHWTMRLSNELDNAIPVYVETENSVRIELDDIDDFECEVTEEYDMVLFV